MWVVARVAVDLGHPELLDVDVDGLDVEQRHAHVAPNVIRRTHRDRQLALHVVERELARMRVPEVEVLRKWSDPLAEHLARAEAQSWMPFEDAAEHHRREEVLH